MSILNKVEYLLKHNNILQKAYKDSFSFMFKIMGLFIRTNPKLILFNGHGKKYNDSPKAIYEYILKYENNKGYKFVWAVDNPSKFRIPEAEIVKMDSFKYFIIALKAKYWVSCVNIERGLNFKKNETIYLNTWHGVPLKLIGNAVNERNDYDFSNIDLFCYSGDYEKKIYERDFNVPSENLLLSGLPRNEELYFVTQKDVQSLKNELDIPPGKKVILYAPTWRDSKDGGKSYSIHPPIDITRLQNELQDDYILLLRTHSYTNKLMGIEFNDFVRDFSTYSDINDLLIISDLLISDYSATIFDYSILEKPIFCFAYDYEEYKLNRGFYINLEQELPNGIIKTQDSLINSIKNINYEEECKKTAKFKKRYIETGMNATGVCVEKLLNS